MIDCKSQILQIANLNNPSQGEGGIYGIIVALTIIGLWASSLIYLFTLDLSELHPFWILSLILGQTFLSTGLFITAHDAMHASVFPSNHKINHLIGSVAVTLYGFFSYKELLKKHWLHHAYPASEKDPDFHEPGKENFGAWYLFFMSRYGSWKAMVYWTVTYNFLSQVLHLSHFNLLVFWVIPCILSSLQLFYFGTYLTHKEPAEGYTNPYRTRSNSFSYFLSFLTCYHFGYHEEHHRYPHIPWWRLPAVRKVHLAHESQFD